MAQKINCPNMNHGKTGVTIAYCPTCGDRFKSAASRVMCSDSTHGERRKRGNAFCVDCGKSLKVK